MRFLLRHSPTWDPTPVADALRSEGIETEVAESLSDFSDDGRPTVLLLEASARGTATPSALSTLAASGIGVVALGAPGEVDPPESLRADLLSAFVPAGAGQRQLLIALRSAFRDGQVRRDMAQARAEISARTSELTELTEIGIKLTTEKNYNSLLDQILFQARRITRSDAGSLYLVETTETGERRLRFKLTQNDSRPDIPFVEFTIPIDHRSLAGYTAVEGEPLVIADVYALPPDMEYSFNRSFDERYGYRTKSMLVIPMANHSGEVIGILQLLNRKRESSIRLLNPEDAETHVVAYSPHQVKLVKALAGQAGVALENSQLYEEIERLFEGFVRAAVDAIEQRDPATSGHSERVATLTVGLAQVVDVSRDGTYRQVSFSPEQVREIRYASLLHDFGKVGVREHVLVKEKKLYPAELALIRQRHAFLVRTAQWKFEHMRASFLEEHGRDGYAEFLERLRADHEAECERINSFLAVVLESNEPSVLAEGNFAKLTEFSSREYEELDGTVRPWLQQPELTHLSIRKGSLDDEERRAIEKHVSHTYEFLRQIPWTRDLLSVPDIAHAHHEKLNATGYPRGIAAPEIPIQTRMMTISDIFDALTAKDRPYKRALSSDRALGIMEEEVQGGMLDGDLLRLFIEGRVYELGPDKEG